MTEREEMSLAQESAHFEESIKTTAWYSVMSRAKDEDDDGASMFRMAKMAAWTAWQARAALSPSVGEKEGDVEQPVAFALRWPNDSRLNLSTVFDTRAEAEKYVELCSLGISIVPLFAALSAHKGAEE